MNKEKNQVSQAAKPAAPKGNDQPDKKITKKKVLNIVTTALLVLVILFGIFCSYTAFMTKKGDGVPKIFGLSLFTIQSDSMEPVFYEGDLIIDTSVNPAELKIDDIITFRTVEKGEIILNTHKIIEIETVDNGDGSSYRRFVTKGENAPDKDPMRVHEGDIMGKYSFAIPKLGGVIDFLQTGTGFAIVIVLPVFLFFIYNLVQFFRVFFDYKAKKLRMQIKQDIANGKNFDDEDDE